MKVNSIMTLDVYCLKRTRTLDMFSWKSFPVDMFLVTDDMICYQLHQVNLFFTRKHVKHISINILD